jgi:hypothetical protein
MEQLRKDRHTHEFVLHVMSVIRPRSLGRLESTLLTTKERGAEP